MLDGCVGTCFDLPGSGAGQQHEFVLRMDEFAHLFPNWRQEISYFCAILMPLPVAQAAQGRKDIYLQCRVGKDQMGRKWIILGQASRA